jgi:hypothetical protein
MWRAEEPYRLTGRVFNRSITASQLLAYFHRRQSKQDWMGHGVIAE